MLHHGAKPQDKENHCARSSLSVGAPTTRRRRAWRGLR